SEGTPILELITDHAARAKLLADLQRALQGERHGTIEWWRPCDTAPRLIDADYHPVHDLAGAIIGVAVVMRDRSSPTEREAAFEHLERRYRALLRALGDGIVVVGEHGRVLEANETFAAMMGESPPRILDSHLSDWHAGPRPEVALAELRASLDHPRRFETILRRRDGTYLPVEVAASPVMMDGIRCVLYAVRDITERREAERALADRESRLSAIVDHAPLGIGVVDLVTGQLLEANPKMQEMYGRTLDEIGTTPINEFTHPEDRGTERQFLEALGSGRLDRYTLRKRYVHPDGTTVPAELSVIRLPDELGRHPVALGIGSDLRTVAEAEASVRESEERYRRLADNAQDIIYRVRLRPTLRVEYISPRVQELIGRSPQEFYADPQLPYKAVLEEDRETLYELLTGASGAGAPRLLRWLRPDGSLLWMEHRSTTLRAPDGSAEAVEGIARDVTAQVAREQQLRLVERALEQLVEVVVITDRSGRIVQVNDAFERVTGYTRAEALGHTPRLLKSGRQDAGFYERMWRALSAGKVFAATVVNRRKDGSLYDAELVVSPVRDAAGEVSHFVGLQRDVTLDRARDEQLRQAQKMEAMGQVTGGIAHDFNNLLTVILASANIIEDELPPGGEAAGSLRDMVHAARHGTMMVRQLLAFGRHGNLTPAPTDLGRVAGDFLDVLRRVIPETIRIDPLQGHAPIALADRVTLEQILLNLANNAKDAMPQGGTLSFALGESPHPATGTPFATIAVTDSGIGMDADTLRRCREPFFTTKPVGKGTGLGLSMVHGLMQQLGGRLEITSAPGVGSTFTLHFPLASSVAVPTPAPLSAGVAATPKLEARILLAEDNDALRRVAVRTLQRAGCEVVTAEDGEEAWRLWQETQEPFDLLLTDAVMPRLGGVQLIERVRDSGASLPIVLMSGYNAEDLSQLPAGVRLLPKPWTGETLLQKLMEALAGEGH
ncbi:MAG TPA: PAS domain S-box protein, partial [Gemmatimonadales bacterium]|nr:PAS domain S-box protein [Gemmatimonadales bacterium]